MHCLLITLLAWGAVGIKGQVADSQLRAMSEQLSSVRNVHDDYTVDEIIETIDTSTPNHALSENYIVDKRNSPFDKSKTAGIELALHVDNIVEVDTITRTRRSVDTSRTGGVDWNNVVDTIFSVAKEDISGLGKNVLPLSNVRLNFKRKFGFLTVNGSFLANQGTLRDLTSFQRSGDVSAVKEGSVYKMVCALTLHDLRVKYEHYELDVFGFGPRGHIEGTVNSNTIRMTLIFSKYAEGCLSTLQEIKLTELGGLRVNVSGLGDLDSLGSAIATWIVEQRRTEIVDTIERRLAREIEEALKDFQCDEYASLLSL